MTQQKRRAEKKNPKSGKGNNTKLLRADPDAFTLAKGAACFAADPAASTA